MAKSKSGKPVKSKSHRAGLSLPAARVNRAMKKSSGLPRIGGSAPIYLTAVLEYVVAEVMEIAGNHTLAAKPGRKRITPEDIVLAVRGDEELGKLFKNVSVFAGDKIKMGDALKPAEPKEKSQKASGNN